jgi:hypothetical protein
MVSSSDRGQTTFMPPTSSLYTRRVLVQELGGKYDSGNGDSIEVWKAIG